MIFPAGLPSLKSATEQSVREGNLRVAAQVAEQIEETIRDLVGPCRITVEAERHWADPYNYELEVRVEPLGDPVEALERLAEEGEGVLRPAYRINGAADAAKQAETVQEAQREQFATLATAASGPTAAIFRGLASPAGPVLARAVAGRLREAGALGLARHGRPT